MFRDVYQSKTEAGHNWRTASSRYCPTGIIGSLRHQEVGNDLSRSMTKILSLGNIWSFMRRQERRSAGNKILWSVLFASVVRCAYLSETSMIYGSTVRGNGHGWMDRAKLSSQVHIELKIRLHGAIFRTRATAAWAGPICRAINLWLFGGGDYLSTAVRL
jgi:hypothetical protein